MLIIKYSVFAVISTTINILVQIISFVFFKDWWAIYLALSFGTIAGLITKYVLDKRWIFEYAHTNSRDNVIKFSLYSLSGLFTTAIFWLTEMYFYFNFEFIEAKYLGGFIGLFIGYVVKYNLDKRYVFGVVK